MFRMFLFMLTAGRCLLLWSESMDPSTICLNLWLLSLLFGRTGRVGLIHLAIASPQITTVSAVLCSTKLSWHPTRPAGWAQLKLQGLDPSTQINYMLKTLHPETNDTWCGLMGLNLHTPADYAHKCAEWHQTLHDGDSRAQQDHHVSVWCVINMCYTWMKLRSTSTRGWIS